MRESAKTYKETAQKLESVKENLKKQIHDLKNTHWKSDAGEAFMEEYEETWAVNAEKYAAVMREMADQLERAANDYDTVTDKINQIGKY